MSKEEFLEEFEMLEHYWLNGKIADDDMYDDVLELCKKYMDSHAK